MATTVALRKILDRKQWELVASPPTSLQIGSMATACNSTLFDQYQMWGDFNVGAYLYDPREDAWAKLPSSGMASFGQSGAVCYHTSGPAGTASAGAAATITTTLTLPGSLAGYTIRITGGTGAGQERTIASNTYGANSVITVLSNWGTNPDNTSTFLLLTGRFWFFNGNTTVGLRYYDVATNTWSSALNVTGISASGSEWRIAATPAFGNTVASGTATSGSSTTLVNSGKAWATNQWANYQVRITGGTGAGQVRTVSSNTGTAITVASSWSTNPDATSVYAVEGNDDFLYAAGGGAVTLYRYSISGNTWSTLSPGVARTASPGTGMSLSWIAVTSDPAWADETGIKNGRYLYSFQAGGSGNLSYYDIAANTWINLTTGYQRGGGDCAPASGYHIVADREFVYVVSTSPTGTSSPCWRYNAVSQSLDPWAMWNYPFSSFITGNRTAVATYTDGGTTIRWLYVMPGSAASGPAPYLRMMII